MGEIQVEIEKNHQFFGAGFSGAPGKKKYLDKILRDIYSYYGVTKEDIAVLEQYKRLDREGRKEVRQFIKFKHYTQKSKE